MSWPAHSWLQDPERCFDRPGCYPEAARPASQRAAGGQWQFHGVLDVPASLSADGSESDGFGDVPSCPVLPPPSGQPLQLLLAQDASRSMGALQVSVLTLQSDHLASQ